MTGDKARRGGEILVDALTIHGADTLFCVPGESFLAVLDALRDRARDIRVVTCRQEGGAANMAEAYGKLTGRPGLCFVTRGPGATNASIGIHTAFQDSTPVILMIGQVGRGHLEREAFQEIDYRRMYGQMAKWVAQIDDPARIPEFISRAYHTATSGRPGPVVLALPEDVLSASARVDDVEPYAPVAPAPREQDVETAFEMLAAAERPFVLLGGAGWSQAACADMRRFVEDNDLPAGTSFRCQDLLDNRSPNYVGDVGIAINPKLAQIISDADVILAVGPRLGEMTTAGYTLLRPPVPKQTLIHVHTGAEELNRVYRARLAINSGMAPFVQALAGRRIAGAARWQDWTKAARAAYEAHVAGQAGSPSARPAIDLAEVFRQLRARLPDDAILTNGAGAYTVWAHRYFEYRTFRTQLAPTSGAMGYGVPAAIAAKIAAPERTVVAVAGDGCFLMTGQELATAVRERAAVLILVINNNMYGTIRLHQDRSYPGRAFATDLTNPDFAAYARAFGAFGEVVTCTDQFASALDRALEAGCPAVIELRTEGPGHG